MSVRTLRPPAVDGVALLAAGTIVLIVTGRYVISSSAPVRDRIVVSILLLPLSANGLLAWLMPRIRVGEVTVELRWFGFGRSSQRIPREEISSVVLTDTRRTMVCAGTVDFLDSTGQLLASIPTRQSAWFRRGPWSQQTAQGVADALGVPFLDSSGPPPL